MAFDDTTLRIAGTVEESIVDGPGLRYALFVQGCPHHCPGCHNPETHPVDGGREIALTTVLKEIEANPLIRRVTLSGGEPFAQCRPLITLARELRNKGYELLAYTGYLFEDLLERNDPRELLSLLDMLMDGPYIAAQRTLTLRFRGSANQRIIDVPASLAKGRTILHPLN